MNLNDLSAEDLARIDSICLAFESKLREGDMPSIERLVSEFGGDYAELLRQELLAIQSELDEAVRPVQLREPFSIPLADSPEDVPETPPEHDPAGQLVEVLSAGDSVGNVESASTIEAEELSETPAILENNAAEQIEIAPFESDNTETIAASASQLFVQSEPQADQQTDEPPAPSSLAAPSVVRDEAECLLPLEGSMIGPYRIGPTIGKGGMGVVFAATDVRLNRKVAIKVLSVRGNKRQELTERFEREAKAVAALSHPNIVELFDVGVDQGVPYAVMEYLDGESLVDRLAREPLSLSEIRRLGAQICDALDVAHRGGVIHRDLKPQNVMLIRRSGGDGSNEGVSTSGSSASTTAAANDSVSSSLMVKLVDFGLSRVPRSGLSNNLSDDHSQATREGMILGTPGYMAPEQARGDAVTTAADIFSLGCVLFEAFYGRPAITGETVADRFASTLEGTPTPDPIRRRADVGLADLIDECLRKAPEERPISAADLAIRLRRTVPPINPVKANIDAGYAAGEMVRRRFLSAAAGGLVGAVVGGIAKPNHTRELMGIERLAVLSFQATGTSAEKTQHGLYVKPVANQDLQRGEILAGLLVNELSRIQSVAVTPFRPLVANGTDEYIALGSQLGVDAFVAGNYRMETQGTAEFVHLNLSIVSARTGVQLWGDTIISDASNNLLEQTRLAESIASAIGHGLTSSASAENPVNSNSFGCLVDGRLRADPDSVAGLEKAIMCLEEAKKADISYGEPRAAIALASITLAAQSSPDKAAALILKAREELAYLEMLGGGVLRSIDARLANAMLDWQTLHRYTEAEKEINELAMIAPNHWQVQHQRGILLLALGRQQLARQALKVAKLLYPMSATLKIDLARAEWFSGNVERAKNDADLVLQRVPCHLAKGLLIDIHEHQQEWQLAAKLHAGFPSPESKADYMRERESRLLAQPYGPFGSALNLAIFRLRSRGQMDDASLAELIEYQSPMLPLLLAAHPAFSATQLLDRAQEMLPSELTGKKFS